MNVQRTSLLSVCAVVLATTGDALAQQTQADDHAFADV